MGAHEVKSVQHVKEFVYWMENVRVCIEKKNSLVLRLQRQAVVANGVDIPRIFGPGRHDHPGKMVPLLGLSIGNQHAVDIGHTPLHTLSGVPGLLHVFVAASNPEGGPCPHYFGSSSHQRLSLVYPNSRIASPKYSSIILPCALL